MTVRPILLLLSASAAFPAAAQRGSPVHRWAPLLQIEADRVEIDTATIHRVNSMVQVWLRWSTASGVPDLPGVYSLEQRQVDCGQQRSRVLQTVDVRPRQPTLDVRPGQPGERIGIGAEASGTAAVSVSPKWERHSPGGLLALATGAVCRFSKQAGA